MSSTGEGLDPDVRATEVDGVPTFWMPVEGPLTASLMFRVGRADERLAAGGVTHLVEHLALYPFGAAQARFAFNGYVDAVTTVFTVQAGEEEVVDFLNGVCTNLHSLPLDRLDVERSILRSEASQHTPTGPVASMLRWRYGSRTFGLASFEEFGLHHLGPDAVTDWARQNFTRGNAALWLTGSPPSGLSLGLPAGDRRATPVPSSALTGLPSWYAEGTGATSMLTIVQRSTAAQLLGYLLDLRLRATLRYELGVSYSPYVGYEPRTGEDASLVMVAEAVEGHEGPVAEGMAAALSAVAAGQVDEKDLAHWRSKATEMQSDPGGRRGFVHAWCWNHLQGGREWTWPQLLQEMHDVTPADIASAAAEAASDALYRVPEGQEPPLEGLVPAPVWSAETFSGREFPVVRMSKEEPLHVLVVGTSGVSLRQADGKVASVPFADCEALLRWPDGHRALFGADGFIVEIAPTAWIDAAEAAKLVDAGVDPDRHVDMPEVAEAGETRAVVEPSKQWFFVAFFAGLTVVAGAAFVDGQGELAGPLIWAAVTAVAVYFLARARKLRGLRGFPTRWRVTK
jgi:zinc protease